MIKLVNKLDETNAKSLYSGKSAVNVEMSLRAMPKFGKDGNPLQKKDRYYVFRMLFWNAEDRSYPFIVRWEHQYFRKDATGKIIDVNRICCPTTSWAKKKINEVMGQDYCPICKMSFEQNAEAWKNFKSTKQIDKACLQIANDTKRVFAAYLPVYVVNDPYYKSNNNHFRVLRLSGPEGKSTLERIQTIISEANEKGITVFNGGEGANIAFLCEKQPKLAVKKDGSPIIDSSTGKQRSYEVNAVTDVRLMSKLRAYPQITEEEIEKLQFDETYGVPATRDKLNVFLHENYLDTGASDADFGDDEDETTTTVSDDDFGEAEEVATTKATTKSVPTKADEAEDEFTEADAKAEENDFGDESPMDTISRITNGKVPKTVKMADTVAVELPPDTDSLRNTSTDFSDDDLPF